MLAETTTFDDLKDLKFPVLVSPKLDGIRCVIRDGVALTRKLKRIPNEHIQKTLAGLPDGLDGELIVGGLFDNGEDTVMARSQSGVMSADGEPDFTYWVFDYCHAELGFSDRLNELKEALHGEARDGYPVKLVPHLMAYTEIELDAMEDHYVREGYEGVMIRAIDGPYKYGRSTLAEGWLLKLKRFFDTEATIVGFVEKMTNNNETTRDERGYAKKSSAKAGKVGAGTLGALVAHTASGIEFEIGTGFDDALRADIWARRGTLLGASVTYKYQGFGSKGKPRFPVFLGFRDAADIGEPDAQ